MIRDAIQKIEEMALPRIEEIKGHTYAISKGDVIEILPEVFKPERRELYSLDALVKLVKTEAVQKAFELPIYITIPTPTSVICYSKPNPDARLELKQTAECGA